MVTLFSPSIALNPGGRVRYPVTPVISVLHLFTNTIARVEVPSPGPTSFFSWLVLADDDDDGVVTVVVLSVQYASRKEGTLSVKAEEVLGMVLAEVAISLLLDCATRYRGLVRVYVCSKSDNVIIIGINVVKADKIQKKN